MSGREFREWTRESEHRALARLQRERPLVLVYARQSKSDFNPDGTPRGPSLDAQLQAYERIAELAGCPVELYQDADKSGRETSQRSGYLDMVRRLRASQGSVGAVFCYDQDRLHRNVVKFYEFMQDCEAHGVLVFDAGGLVRNEDELAWGIKAVVASVERKKIARRVRDNLHYLKVQGRLLGHAPIGYQRDHETGTLELDPDAAPVVRTLFELYAGGRYSFQTLASYLNQAGVPVPRNTDYPKERTKWSLNLLKGLLNNPSYLGKIRDGERLIPGTHPALIDEQTFAACQVVRGRNRRRRTHYRHHRNTYSLQPLLICGRCGGRMQGHRRPELNRYWYRCANRRGGGCDLPWMLGDVLENAIGRDLRRYLPSGDADSGGVTRLRKVVASPLGRNTKRALKALKDREERVKFMWEHGDLSQESYVERISRINIERQELREEAKDAADADLKWTEERIADVVRIWEESDPIQRSLLVAEVYETIEVDRPWGYIELTPTPNPRWTPLFRRSLLVPTEPGVIENLKHVPKLTEVGVNSAVQQALRG